MSFGSVRLKKTRFVSDISYLLHNSKYYSDSGRHDFDITHNNDK